MSFKIGVVGAGQFAKSFVPLFQAHPYVTEVALAEIVPERRERYATAFGLKQTYATFEEIITSDVDAVAIFTQRHLHGKQVLEALRAGKHVYSAVPVAQSIDEIAAIIDEVKRSGLIYMTGETSYYYPSTVFCRSKFKNKEMGDFVYGEAQYLHDMEHGFYDAFKYSGGENWKRVAGIPPMYYPTHSVSMITSVTGATAKTVSAMGYRDRANDGVFGKGNNNWDNPFSNETGIFSMSDGGIMRINEFRRVGWGGRNSVYLSMFGTKGSYEEHAGGSAWTTIEWGHVENVTNDLETKDEYIPFEKFEKLHAALENDFNSKLAKVHHKARLPRSYDKMPNGHFGSHQFLVDDFMKSLRTMKLPPNHIWNAARYFIPGYIAHESALKNGELLHIPDLGDAPATWEQLDPESYRAE